MKGFCKSLPSIKRLTAWIQDDSMYSGLLAGQNTEWSGDVSSLFITFSASAFGNGCLATLPRVLTSWICFVAISSVNQQSFGGTSLIQGAANRTPICPRAACLELYPGRPVDELIMPGLRDTYHGTALSSFLADQGETRPTPMVRENTEENLNRSIDL